MVVPIIETVRSVRNLRSLLKVDGVEVFFLSPADYEVSQGAPLSPEGTAAAPDHDETVRNIRKHGKHAGMLRRTKRLSPATGIVVSASLAWALMAGSS